MLIDEPSIILAEWSSIVDVVALEHEIKVCIGVCWWEPPIASHCLTSGHCACSILSECVAGLGAVILNALAKEMAPVVIVKACNLYALASSEVRFKSVWAFDALPTDVLHFTGLANFLFAKSIICGEEILRALDLATLLFCRIIEFAYRAGFTAAVKTQIFTLGVLAYVPDTDLAVRMDITTLWTCLTRSVT